MDIILLLYIVLMALIPLPPSFLLNYNLPTLLLRWKLPDIARVFLVSMSIWSISLKVQSNIPTADVKVGTANALWALLKFDSWEFQIFPDLYILWWLFSYLLDLYMRCFHQFKDTYSCLPLQLVWWLSPLWKSVWDFALPFLFLFVDKHAHLPSPNCIFMSRENVAMISNCFFVESKSCK